MSSHLPGKFIWFEHASADTAKARSFYERLFDWHVEAMPMGDGTYDMLMNGGAGIGGLVDAKAGTPTAWQSYISVPDVDAAYRAALAAGAASVAAPADFPPVGRGATIVDPTGATVSLWKSTQGDRPDPAETPVGSWYWNELLTSDAQRALAFYAQVFGYTHETMDMGQPVPYIVLQRRRQAARRHLPGAARRSDAVAALRARGRLRRHRRPRGAARRPGVPGAHRHPERRPLRVDHGSAGRAGRLHQGIASDVSLPRRRL
jgi:predicted enzyme related to lactoylglutathione lyase